MNKYSVCSLYSALYYSHHTKNFCWCHGTIYHTIKTKKLHAKQCKLSSEKRMSGPAHLNSCKWLYLPWETTGSWHWGGSFQEVQLFDYTLSRWEQAIKEKQQSHPPILFHLLIHLLAISTHDYWWQHMWDLLWGHH